MLGSTDALVYDTAFERDCAIVTENHMDFLAMARAAQVHPGLILMAADGASDQVRAFHAARDLIEREAVAADEAPRDWLVSRWVYASAAGQCRYGATDDDSSTP